MQHWENLWLFNTARFSIHWDIAPCYDLDLSWDETGEVSANIESGFWQAFDCRVRVLLDGVEVATDHLGQCIYENPSDFRDHFGMKCNGHGSYFSDMVKNAVNEARKLIGNMPKVRFA